MLTNASSAGSRVLLHALARNVPEHSDPLDTFKSIPLVSRQSPTDGITQPAESSLAPNPHSHHLSAGAITGIVLAAGIGAHLVVGVAICLYMRRRRRRLAARCRGGADMGALRSESRFWRLRANRHGVDRALRAPRRRLGDLGGC